MSAPRTFTREQVLALMNSNGTHCKIVGREIEADIDRTGHFSYKLNPGKGVYLDAATGVGGTIASLLQRRGMRPPVAVERSTPARPGFSVPGEPPEQGEDSQARAYALWGKSWTCTHEQDLPAGWDKGLNAAQKGARRAALERQRDRAIAYLRGRLGDAHLLHWLRQVRIGPDGPILAPMQLDGRLVGVQRTFLRPDGTKERRMLGRHGVMPLPAPVGVLPADLDGGRACVIVAEGLETNATVVEAAGHPGIVTFDAGGLLRWAREQSERLRARPDAVEKAPTVILLVDRDQSETGQRACAAAAKILRSVGVRVRFALPRSPEDGGPRGGLKGSDWADYVQESLAHAIRPHLALAILAGDDELRSYLDASAPEKPAAVAATVASLRPWRPAADAKTPAAAADVADVRQGLRSDLMRLVDEYLAWWRRDPTDRGPFAPWLFQVTTGVGKTHDLVGLIRHIGLRQDGARVCVGVQNHDQAKDFESEGWFHFLGRQPDESRCADAYCPAYSDMNRALERGHVTQAEYCHTCSHGLAWAIDRARAEIEFGGVDGEREDELRSRIEGHERTLRWRGLEPESVERCRWQGHLRRAMDAQFVVMVAQSYSHAVAHDALFVLDESADLSLSTAVSSEDIAEWARRLRELTESDDETTTAAARAAVPFMQGLADGMARWIGAGKSGSITLDAGLVESIQALLEEAKLKGGTSIAHWEHLRFAPDGTLRGTPLRAAFALAESLHHGQGFVQDGRLVVAASNPIIERLRAGKPTAFLDATPDPVTADIVRAKGGKVVHAVAKQNIRVIRHPRRFWGVATLNAKHVGQDRVEAEKDAYRAVLAAHEGAAALVHKRAYDALGLEGDDSGYWGAHHRAHNNWKGRNLLTIGGFYAPLDTWRAEYEKARIAALAAGCAPESWPVWPDDMPMVDGAWVPEGVHEVQSRMPLPADARIREWLLSRVTAETVQAIGRARGANAVDTLTVHIYGGLPLWGLWEHGLTVDAYDDDADVLGKGKAGLDAEARAAGLAALTSAASRVVASGETITRATLEKGLCRQGNGTYTYPAQTPGGPHERVYQDWRARIIETCPVLAAYLAQTGRGADTVGALRAAAERWGQALVLRGLELAESLLKQGADGVGLDLDDPVEMVATIALSDDPWYWIDDDVPIPIPS